MRFMCRRIDYRADQQPATAKKVSDLITVMKPDYTVHLCDVYYARTADEEDAKFTSLWPEGTSASFTLNSKQEMYSGALGYFQSCAERPQNSPHKAATLPCRTMTGSSSRSTPTITPTKFASIRTAISIFVS